MFYSEPLGLASQDLQELAGDTAFPRARSLGTSHPCCSLLEKVWPKPGLIPVLTDAGEEGNELLTSFM